MMPRNLDRRVEALAAVKSPELREQLKLVLDLALSDNCSAWTLDRRGTWTQGARPRRRDAARLPGAADAPPDASMLEQELKLSVEGAFAPTLPARAQRRRRASRSCAPLDLRATYYDTPDLRLARHGVTLRHRTGEGERPGWTREAARSATAIADGRDELHFDGRRRARCPQAARDLVTRLRALARRWRRSRGCARAAGAGRLRGATARSWRSWSTTASRCCSGAGWSSASARSRSRAAASTATALERIAGVLARDGVDAAPSRCRSWCGRSASAPTAPPDVVVAGTRPAARPGRRRGARGDRTGRRSG